MGYDDDDELIGPVPEDHEFRAWIPALETESDAEFCLARRAESVACERVAEQWIVDGESATYRVHVRHLCACQGAYRQESVFSVQVYPEGEKRVMTACETISSAVPESLLDTGEKGAG